MSSSINIKDWNTWNKFIESCLCSKKEFTIRFGILMLINKYIDHQIDYALQLLKKVDCNKYYVRMSVAWLLSTAAIKYFNKVLIFCKSCKDNVILKMTLRKMKDSYRISVDKITKFTKIL
jgi:hypothetical protein